MVVRQMKKYDVKVHLTLDVEDGTPNVEAIAKMLLNEMMSETADQTINIAHVRPGFIGYRVVHVQEL